MLGPYRVQPFAGVWGRYRVSGPYRAHVHHRTAPIGSTPLGGTPQDPLHPKRDPGVRVGSTGGPTRLGPCPLASDSDVSSLGTGAFLNFTPAGLGRRSNLLSLSVSRLLSALTFRF